jgi:hypothetical protein
MWYVQRSGAALGPHRGDALARMIGRSLLDRSTLVAKVGWKDWAALGDVPVFKGFLAGRAAGLDGVAKEALPDFG